MTAVVIIDYGLCNLDSIARSVEKCGGDVVVTGRPDGLDGADRIILPGVGAFPRAMANLREHGMDKALDDAVRVNKTPFLGICLGMHLIAGHSLEGGETAGLGWISGTVKRLRPTGGERVPHMGWNEVGRVADRPAPLLGGIEDGKDFYFVHGYYLECNDPVDIQGRTPYCGGFVSMVGRDNIFGVQFHPEKSQKPGFRLLQNFMAADFAAPC